MLIIELGADPLTNPISLKVSNGNIEAANPSAIAETSASRADEAH